MEICGRLDGIPLAIELAASRMQSMTVTEMRDRLDDGSGCWSGRGGGWSATKHCVMRWGGRTTCSMTLKRQCWNAVRCSQAGLTFKVLRRCGTRRRR